MSTLIGRIENGTTVMEDAIAVQRLIVANLDLVRLVETLAQPDDAGMVDIVVDRALSAVSEVLNA